MASQVNSRTHWNELVSARAPKPVSAPRQACHILELFCICAVICMRSGMALDLPPLGRGSGNVHQWSIRSSKRLASCLELPANKSEETSREEIITFPSALHCASQIKVFAGLAY